MLAAIILYFAMHNGGAIEGIINPVVSVVQLDVSKDEDNDGWAEVSGDFFKLRNCNLHTLEWFWSGESGATRVPVMRSTTPIRDVGDQHFESLLVHMDYKQLKEHSYAIVYHECHPLWKTSTKFYP